MKARRGDNNGTSPRAGEHPHQLASEPDRLPNLPRLLRCRLLRHHLQREHLLKVPTFCQLCPIPPEHWVGPLDQLFKWTSAAILFLATLSLGQTRFCIWLQGVPTKMLTECWPNNITKIRSFGGAKFSHGQWTWLGGVWSRLVLIRNDKKFVLLQGHLTGVQHSP